MCGKVGTMVMEDEKEGGEEEIPLCVNYRDCADRGPFFFPSILLLFKLFSSFRYFSENQLWLLKSTPYLKAT